jgi:superfamily II DNA or RNA helicase
MKILERFELVIVEEAHEVSGEGFYTVMAACRNAHYRMALTATPFMKDDEQANMRLLACCGPVAIQITEKLLIDRGILAKPYFKFVAMPETTKPKRLARSTPWQRAYEEGVVKNEYRNKVICAEVLRGARYGLNAMVLVQHKAHGEILQAMMHAAGLRVQFIYGEDNQTDRDAALRALGSGALNVLIGSTILDVGVDVPSVGIIVLAGGGKAEVATRQRVGRGLREKKRGPNVALIVDIADDHNMHLKGHYLQRRAIIAGTPGFAENIVGDFDYVGLAFARKVDTVSSVS